MTTSNSNIKVKRESDGKIRLWKYSGFDGQWDWWEIPMEEVYGLIHDLYAILEHHDVEEYYKEDR